MSVDITWSLTNGGTAISTTVDHGSKANGETSTVKEFFVRHDGINEITSTKIFIRAFSGTYLGGTTAAADLAELLNWGDQTTSGSFGGIQVNMDAVNSYPAAQWPTYSAKDTTYGFAHRTGVGDSEGNGVLLSKNSYSAAGTDGVIPAGASPNVRFQARVVVPSDEDTVGIRQWETVLAFNYTS